MKRISFLAPVLLLAASGSPAFAVDIHVTGAPGVKHSLLTLADGFQRITRNRVIVGFGNAAAVTTKFDAGERIDVLISSTGELRDLTALGKLAGEPAPVGKTRVGVAVCNGGSSPDTSTPEKLKAALLTAPSFSYGDPARGATAGVHFASVLTQLGVADQVKSRAQLREGDLEVIDEVAAGKAAFGFTQSSEITATSGCDIAGYLPDSLQLVTTYAIALTKDSKKPAAKAFIDFALGARGAEIFRTEGLDPLK